MIILRPRTNLMWGRSNRAVVICATAVVMLVMTSRLFSSVSSPEDISDEQITEEQMRVLRAFSRFAARDQKRGEKPALVYVEKKDLSKSPARVRSDALIGNLQKICQNFNVTIPLTAFMLAHMHFDHKRQAVYCFTPKVACTSWKRIWMKMTGIVKPEKDLAQLSRYTIHTSIPTMASMGDKVPEMLAKYKKFMFVRHPFDRVLSAYKDKLEHKDTESSYNFHKEIGVRILNKYRTRGLNYTGDDVTFPEFMRFISEPGHGTFEQRNEHWLTIHEICNPCAVKYDFIGKYENLKEDAHYLLDWLGASNLTKEFPVSDRPFHAKRYEPKYFNQLDHKTKLSFFQKYLLDFAAFNYTFV
ncbi:carbohydrate sulfotransferase 11-like isoform X2 [Palaemon carinicauda]|uniref:carbohydrate sulfotransferase 11-like isoform X2 n=1 Tax=Palaemon carinicauda TaxID=392227 RepID=UPI0035B5F878